MGCEVDMRPVITNEGNKGQPWHPKIRCVEDRYYVKIQKWCRAFTRFCTGRSLDLRKGKGHSLSKSSFVDDLIVKLHEISVEAARELILAQAETDADRNRAKRRKIRPADSALSPHTVMLTLPAVAEFEEKDIRCLWSVSGADMWVHLEARTLDHIRAGVLRSMPKVTGAGEDAESAMVQEEVQETIVS